MDVRLTTSATQISEFLTCQRRWVAKYILKDKEPQSEAMAFGEAGHKMLETYAKTGIVPDPDLPWQFKKDSKIRYPGLSARKALKHIPGPKIGRAEHGFSFTINGIKFIGYIDREWEDNDGLWVTDYKFVSSYQSALDADSLQSNVQATIYATKAILEKKVSEVNLKWVYILSTKNPTARPITTKLAEEKVKKHLKKLLIISEKMIEVREHVINQLDQNVPHNDILNLLPPTVESCSRYAGCYYTNRCDLTPEQLMQGDFETMDQTLADQLKAMGMDKYIKDKPEPETKPEPEVKQETASVPETKPGLDLSKFIKTPATPAKDKEKPKEPAVQLNAPENYMDTDKPAAEKPQKQTTGLLTKEEIDTFIHVVRTVLNHL